MAGRRKTSDRRTPAALGKADRLILSALQENARLTTAELAERAVMSPSPCWRRVRRLEEEGVITGYHAAVDPARLGYGVMAYVMLGIESNSGAETETLEAEIARIPEVVECVGISGSDDYLLAVVARDLTDYYESVFDRIRRLPLVKRTQSTFVMKRVKVARGVPVPEED